MTIKYNGISIVTKLINSVKTRPKTHNFSVDKANKLRKYHTAQKYKLFFLTFHLLHRRATTNFKLQTKLAGNNDAGFSLLFPLDYQSYILIIVQKNHW